MRKLKSDTAGNISIKSIIGIVIFVVVALVLFPLIQSTVGPMITDNYSGDGATATTSGSTKTILENLGVFYVLMILFGVIGGVLFMVKD